MAEAAPLLRQGSREGHDVQDSLLVSGLRDSAKAGLWEKSLEKGRTDLHSRELGKDQGLEVRGWEG